jgi:hypothetical protein
MRKGQLFGWGQSVIGGGLAPTWWRSEAEMNLYKTALAVFYLALPKRQKCFEDGGCSQVCIMYFFCSDNVGTW